MKKVHLFERKSDCCGCSACASVCPKQAIAMRADEYGFLYPVIDEDKCIACGLCKSVCAFSKENENPTPIEAYAVQAREDKLLENSASGGVFAVLAGEFLARGGAAAGCAMVQSDGGLTPRHVVIRSADELPVLQGSKYVQSSIGDGYKKVKELLDGGLPVLFSGTPCQVDGLRRFLLGKEYPNLLTVDLICHGVPSAKMFSDYLSVFEKKLGGTVTEFRFRDKSDGWGLNGSVHCTDKNGKSKVVRFAAKRSSFYKLFLDGEIYRDSCYRCPYACLKRSGDLTLGDFWGIERQHSEALLENGGGMSEKKGISCVLVNTEKGRKWVEVLASETNMVLSDLQKAAEENHQLSHPSSPGENRETILTIYKKSGYGAVERWFHRHEFKRKCKRKLKKLLFHR